MAVSRARSAHVAAPPERVWATLADFAAISRWAGEVTHSAALTSPGAGIGAVRRVQVGREAMREQVTIWEPERRLAYTVTGLPKVVRRVTNTWDLVPAGDGTLVTVTAAVTTRPPFLARLIIGRLVSVTGQLLTDLAEHHRSAEAAR
jgi:uncharacterized protein YndB with AHSA1/START domain